MYSITVKNQKVGPYGGIRFDLAITGDPPLFIGCTVTMDDVMYDQPGKWIESNILSFVVNMISIAPRRRGNWRGKIMFALWRDDSFTERLADSDWVEWIN